MEEENAQLRTELASVREELAKALDAMTALIAAQEQPASSTPETTEAIPTSSLDSRFTMPRGYHTDSHLSLPQIPQQVLPVLPTVTKSPSQGRLLSTLPCLSQQSSPIRLCTLRLRAPMLMITVERLLYWELWKKEWRSLPENSVVRSRPTGGAVTSSEPTIFV